MLKAAFASLSSTRPQCTHVWVRSSRSLWGPFLRQPLQIWLVFRGFTNRTVVCPALSALTRTIPMKLLHPASAILLLSPPFAAAPLGRYFPSESCFGFGRRL